jgi:hypothetical protein
MPDAVVIRVSKEDWAAQAEQIAQAERSIKAEKSVPPSRWRWAITWPWRALRGVVASCWRRLTGARVKE